MIISEPVALFGVILFGAFQIMKLRYKQKYTESLYNEDKKK